MTPVATTRQKIYDAAILVFTKHGAKRVTVEELCREAGVSRVTFYKYFKNKEALILEIRDTWMNEGFAYFDEISARDIPFPEKIAAMTQWKVAFSHHVGPEFFRGLDVMDGVADEFKRRYLANVRTAQVAGEVRDDISPEVLWLVVQKFEDIYKEGHWKDAVSDPADLTRQFRTLIWFGLLTRPEEGDAHE